MAKFNTKNVTARNTTVGPIVSERVASGTTHEGAPGYARVEKSELFLLAVSDFVGEGSFYEDPTQRNDRLVTLARKVAVADPEWTAAFVNWLRQEANMRSAALVVALEGAKGLVDAGVPGGRALVRAGLHRADEPGEALAYWFANHGRKVPAAVKRGIADAAVGSYNEYSLGKYDTKAHGFRFGDVIDLVHPSPKDAKQSDLFKFALDRRRDSAVELPASLELLRNRAAFTRLSGADVRSLVESGEAEEVFKGAGLTWENLSGAIAGGMDAKAWEAVIPSMGYMALLRNLRNFLEAGVSRDVLRSVAARLADADEVAKSRQLPMRFLSAYNATSNSTVFTTALEDALDASLSNVPALDGNTLILVDRSGSMYNSPSKHTGLNFADSAALFGLALALRAEKATLVEFGTSSNVVSFRKGDSILPSMKKFNSLGGTNTAQAVRNHLRPEHTRVVLITDEQAWGGYYGEEPTKIVPAKTPVFTFNLVGYARGHGAEGSNRYTIGGGLSDQSFKTISLIETGVSGTWPWETE